MCARQFPVASVLIFPRFVAAHVSPPPSNAPLNIIRAFSLVKRLLELDVS
jgi:hypothetical protein